MQYTVRKWMLLSIPILACCQYWLKPRSRSYWNIWQKRFFFPTWNGIDNLDWKFLHKWTSFIKSLAVHFLFFFLMSILLVNNSSNLRSFINEWRTDRMPATTESLIVEAICWRSQITQNWTLYSLYRDNFHLDLNTEKLRISVQICSVVR